MFFRVVPSGETPDDTRRNPAGPGRADLLLLLSFVIPAVYLFLFLFRGFDDNALVRWSWVFSSGKMVRLIALIPPVLLVSFFLSRYSVPDRLVPFLLFAVSFAAVVPVWNEPEVILDASRYFLQAKYLEIHGITGFLREWGKEITAWTDLPLIPLLYGVVFRYAGESRIFIQILTSTLYSLTTVIAFLIGKELWSSQDGFNAGMLLPGIPYLLIQAPLMLVDVPAMFFFTAAVYSSLRAIRHGGRIRIVLSVSLVFSALLSKYSLWPMLLCIPLTGMVFMKEQGRAAIHRTALICFLSGLLMCTVLILKWDVFREQVKLLSTYQMEGLKRWKEGFASTFLFQIHPLITCFGLAGIYLAVKGRELRFLVAGWFFVMVALLRIERIRYMIPLFPLLALSAAYGLRVLKYDRVKRFAAYSVAGASVILAVVCYVPFLNTTSAANLRDAGRYLDTLNSEVIRVRSVPQRKSDGSTEMAIPLLDLFTSKTIQYPADMHAHASEGLERSSLRFSWETKMPFYNEQATAGSPLVVISDFEANEKVPGIADREFLTGSGTFRFRTFVRVYDPSALSGKGHW